MSPQITNLLLSLSAIILLTHDGLLLQIVADPTISDCAAKEKECDILKERPVCGSNNQTYINRCFFRVAQCKGHNIDVKYRGPCREQKLAFNYKECNESRSYALAHQTATVNKFIPRCRKNGTYAPIQCMNGSGCWCSDEQGKPIPNTTTRSGRPDCTNKGRINKRRSSPRTMNRNRKIDCLRDDQDKFNFNLINVFYGEYKRMMGNDQLLNSPLTPELSRRVLDWKFNSLDVNSNRLLDKHEYRELKRLVRKVVKPKRCARTFGKFCDVNHDESLTIVEWTNCLTNNSLADDVGGHRTTGSQGLPDEINKHQTQGIRKQSPQLNEYDDEYDDDTDDLRFHNTLKTKYSQMPDSRLTPGDLLKPNPKTIAGTLLKESESETETDCISDRNTALDQEKAPGAIQLYVPECTADGRYKRVQCYKTTGYCWCVNEDTGKNIPGTSMKDNRPQCDTIYPQIRPMKGCPELKKNIFLRELKDFLRKQIDINVNLNINTTKWSSEDEKIATQSFVLLDKNKNRVWERKEWKIFRELVIQTRHLSKCGKKMPRYCDINNDKKITLSEWLNCLQTQQMPTTDIANQLNSTKPTLRPRLKGPNPVDTHLKSD